MHVIMTEKTGTIEAFRELLNQAVAHGQVKGLLILACDANDFTPETIDPLLADLPVPVFGGIFPALISGTDKLSTGTIVVGLAAELNIQIIPRLSDPEADYDALIDERFPALDPGRTMFVLVDGMAKRICGLTDSLFNIFGLEVNYIGGGAGSLSLHQKPCLFTNAGMVADSALLVMTNLHSGIGVSHGWSGISGPFKVTEVNQNVIISLDWQPAFPVYQKAVEQASGRSFSDSNFYDLSKCYPFGINRFGGEKIVRDLIMVGHDESLVSVGEVPPDSYVDILTGDRTTLVHAARNAHALGEAAYRGAPENKMIFFIDCISRALFLGEDFGKEIDAVAQAGIPLFGALTIGEIANSGNDYLEFYNKTAVVGIIEA